MVSIDPQGHHDHPAGDPCALASGRLPAILAMEIPLPWRSRWSAGDAEPNRTYAAELLALTPDVILANGTPEMRALQQLTRSVPIVFANVADPVGQGFVASLPRPAGNITGFMPLEFGQSGKWLELLKEIAPHVTRVAVLLNRDFAAGIA